jgi:hypothetical protein
MAADLPEFAETAVNYLGGSKPGATREARAIGDELNRANTGVFLSLCTTKRRFWWLGIAENCQLESLEFEEL